MFQIDVMSRVPIYEQIINQLEHFILTGTLKMGDQIPSVRSLSSELSINPVTILKAYSELDSREVIHSVPGKGYFVCVDAKEALAKSKIKLLDRMDEMISEMAMAGVPRDVVLTRAREAYDRAKQTPASSSKRNADENP